MDEELKSYVTDYWQSIIDALVQSLKDVGRYASGVTAQRIGEINTTPVTFIYDDELEISVSMPYYAKFMDEGVSGAVNNKSISRFKYTTKMPPISAIRLFMFNRTIVARDYRKISNMKKSSARQNQIDKVQNRLAYAIAYKIWRDGLKPTHFYSKVLTDKKLVEFERELLKGYGRTIINIINI